MRQERERVKLQAAHAREANRARAANEREQKQLYFEQRQQEAVDLNEGLRDYLHDLTTVLQATLSKDDTISFASLRNRLAEPFVPPPHLARPLPPPTRPGFIQGMLPAGERRYRDAVEEHARAEQRRLASLKAARHEHDQAIARRRAEEDEQIAAFEAAYRAGEREAVIAYSSMVLERSVYPTSFPQTFRVTFSPESGELVVDYELPSPMIIPDAESYTYVRARDAVENKKRKASDRQDLYRDVVAAVALRTLHEVFEADQGGHIAVAAFNGFVQSTDPATGQDLSPCLISVRVTRQRFLELNLARVDKQTCLRNLGAQASSQPAELQPVQPIVEFDMVDRRYIEQADILSGLDARPNLMDLTPAEFEHLVGNLFQKMGLETKVTRSSRDGGVDAVAYDLRPVVGGKFVIQAKRYRHTVGVSAVRDLFGTMDHERANKGILVTTSQYGPDAYDFGKGKQIDLVDGGKLLYLLEQVGVKARIIFPDE
jgi:restriction system protein